MGEKGFPPHVLSLLLILIKAQFRKLDSISDTLHTRAYVAGEVLPG